MSRYLVEANGYWLVTVDADSALKAERKLLNLEGVGTALAFDLADPNEMRTDTFLGVVRYGQTASFEEMASMAQGLKRLRQSRNTAAGLADDLRHELDEHRQQLQALEDALKAAEAEADTASDDVTNQLVLLRTPTHDGVVIA